MVLLYDGTLDTVAAFDAVGSTDAVALGVDALGNTAGGKLRRVHVHSKVLWMIWANFFPDTRLYSSNS